MSEHQALDAYPLSPMQAGLLFQSLAHKAGDLYIEQYACPLNGPLDIAAFEQAWELALSRHAPLRTAFAWDGMPQPLQVVGPKVRLPLRKLDWCDTDTLEQDARLEALKREEQLQGFDLGRAPLMRLVLVARGENSHYLIWTWHHIILDAWSGPVLLNEVLTAYAANVSGAKPELPPVRPYKDFIALALAPQADTAATFWRETLSGMDTTHPLELGVVEPAQADEADYQLMFRDLHADRIPAMRACAASLGVTLNTLVQAAWSLVLGRCQGSQDVLFGTAVSGRPAQLEGVERMVGLFINTLPVRAKLGPDQPLRGFLQNLQTQLVQARQYEHMPLADIQACSDIPAGQSMFESLLVFEDFGDQQPPVETAGLQLGAADFTERADFPLTVLFSVRETRQIGVGFERNRIDPASAARLLARLDQALAAIVADTETCLGKIEVLPEAERKRLHGWSRDTDWHAPEGCERSVTRIFEDQVAATPDAPATVFWSEDGDVTLSYRELDARANQLAAHLSQLGVIPGSFVAILMEAGLARIVALLAVIKAGAAYVPLDPQMPSALLAELVADCAAAVVLVDTDSEDLLTGLSPSVTQLCCSEDGAAFAHHSADRPAHAAGPRDAAYMIYTSGSSGRRKGVVIEHEALARMVAAQAVAFEIKRSTRVLQFASFSFDASVSEIFTTLLHGGTLYTAPRQRLLPSQEFLERLERWKIHTLTLPPSVLARLPLRPLPDLKVLVTAGEPCSAELVALWAPGRTYLNAYGPTECTVCATLGAVTSDGQKPSIGRPMGEVEVHVLDRDLRRSPIGAVGELCLSGPQLARGYWQQAELSAAAFVAHPYDSTPGARLYRSGDLVRFLADGRLEYLGRADNQLKLRGRRVEPGEIEAALCAADTVSEAAVIAVGEGGDQSLVAFVTPNTNAKISPNISKGPEWWPSISEFLVYDDMAYHAMSSDERRNDSYRAALAKYAPGKVVLEIGTGPEALLARFAIEAGARKVYAVELLKDTYDKAKAKVRDLGLEDRIEVIHSDATTVTLPEPADVSLSEIVGAIGASEGSAEIINRTRHLLGNAPAIIPEKSVTLFAPVQLPDKLLAQQGFGPLPARYVERIFADYGRPFDLRLCVRGLGYEALLSDPVAFEDFDYRQPISSAYSGETNFKIARRGRCDGFLVWLTLDCGAGPVLDILRHEHCWLPVFFPLGATGLDVMPGDRVETRFGADMCDDGLHTDYYVEGSLQGSSTQQPFSHRAPHHSPAFRNSPFHAQFFAQDSVPRLPEIKPEASLKTTIVAKALSRHLRDRLPDYMQPSQIIELAELPLSTAGKIDRKALLEKANTTRRASPPPTTAPASGAEQQIASIWEAVLGQPADRERNFFEQGGHSLLLLELQTKLQAHANKRIEITDLFKFATIATQAQHFLNTQTPAPAATLAAEASRASARVAARAGLAKRRKRGSKA